MKENITLLTIWDYLLAFEFGSGVYKVHINAEEQTVIVTGDVDPSTLVKKLVKLGKHAEIWNASSNQEHDENIDTIESHYNNQTQPLPDEYSNNVMENHYITSAFGKEDIPLGPEWVTNQNMGNRATGSGFNQNFAAPISIENLYNRGANYFGLGSQEWGWNLPGVSPIKYFQSPSVMSDIHGYYTAIASNPWKWCIWTTIIVDEQIHRKINKLLIIV